MEQIRASAATPLSRGSPVGPSGLDVGQIVRAQVTRVDGDAITLRWGQQSLSAVTNVPVEVGQQISLVVARSTAGKILLRMVDGSLSAGAQHAAVPDPVAEQPSPPPVSGRSATLESRRDSSGQRFGGSGGSQPDGQSRLRGGPAFGDVGAPGSPASRSLNGQPTAAADTIAPMPLAPESRSPAASTPTVAGSTWPGPDVLSPASGRVRGLAAHGGPGPDPSRGSVAGSVAAELTALFAPPDTSLPTDGSAHPSIRAARDWARSYDRLAAAGTAASSAGLMTSPTALGPTVRPATEAGPTEVLRQLGLSPDPRTAAIVAELAARAAPLDRATIVSLRRTLDAAGGTALDARALVALTRLGLPVSAQSLELARQLLEGHLEPTTAWQQTQQRLIDALGSVDVPHPHPFTTLAREALNAWALPREADANALARWLQRSIVETGLPTEAKLAHPVPDPRSLLGDTRARLGTLAATLGTADGELTEVRRAVDGLRSAVLAEQLLNVAHSDPGEPRLFVVTMPSPTPAAGTLELTVRRRPDEAGDRERQQPDILRLQLQLPQLGKLRVNLMVDWPYIGCGFVATTPLAASLLKATSDELTSGLRGLGYELPTVSATYDRSLADTASHRVEAPAPRPIRRVDTRA